MPPIDWSQKLTQDTKTATQTAQNILQAPLKGLGGPSIKDIFNGNR